MQNDIHREVDDSRIIEISINNLEANQFVVNKHRGDWAKIDVDICENPKVFHLSIRDIFVYEELIRYAVKYKKNPISITIGLLRSRLGHRRIKKRDLYDSCLTLSRSKLIEFIDDYSRLKFCQNSLKGKERKGKERKEEVCKVDQAQRASPDAIEQLYDTMLAGVGQMEKIPFNILHSGKARDDVMHSIGMMPNMSDWKELFQRVAATPNLIGTGELKFCATIVWLVNFDNIQKIRAGTFNTVATQKNTPKTFAEINEEKLLQGMRNTAARMEEKQNGQHTGRTNRTATVEILPPEGFAGNRDQS